jgi:hypothetical protein
MLPYVKAKAECMCKALSTTAECWSQGDQCPQWRPNVIVGAFAASYTGTEKALMTRDAAADKMCAASRKPKVGSRLYREILKEQRAGAPFSRVGER